MIRRGKQVVFSSLNFFIYEKVSVCIFFVHTLSYQGTAAIINSGYFIRHHYKPDDAQRQSANTAW